MLAQTAKTFSEFVNLVEAIPLVTGFSVFRGQAIRQNLLPGIARKNPEADTVELERAMLRQLALLGASMLPQGASTLDQLVAAQHFGMKTRLLDWTSNPLAALWFACTDKAPGDAFVYCLPTDGMMLHDPYITDPFQVGSTKVFQPRLNNPRVLAQHGWFTLHAFSSRNNRWVRLETHETASSGLFEVTIPASCRSGMIESLDRHGTSAMTLFPDLSGVCQHINWQHET